LGTKTFANLVGVSSSTISNIETARRSTTVFTIWKIAKHLKCNSVAELFPSFYFIGNKREEESEIQEWEASITNDLNG
jgi:transcriptional regulator with XRE-family HTH domain